MARTVTAAVIIIGDEILSGRTQDTNFRTLASFLGPLGIEVREGRVIPDVHETIVATVQELSKAHDYVFTTGGIGPTHDDITADAVAAAFGRKLEVREEALAVMRSFYAGRAIEMHEGRIAAARRMARIPEGGEMIANPVSAAPGFRIRNVFVLAGVPSIMRGMLEDVGHRLEGGAMVHQHTVRGRGMREGDIALKLGELAKARPEVNLGSYPWMRPGEGKNGQPDHGVAIVARSRDSDMLAAALNAVVELVRSQGIEPEIDPKDPT
jgi:molybdenum cofactor synthesis domain-containing protein